MSTQTHFDFIILGAGIAGLSAADSILKRGKSCAIIDTSKPGSGASGAPKMLMNPATGQRAKMAHKAGESIELIHALLTETESYSGKNLFVKNGVLRPALYPKMKKDFRKALTKYEWPDPGWIDWLDEDQLKESYPYIGGHSGGLILHKGYTVNGNLFIDELGKLLKFKGLKIFTNIHYKIIDSSDSLITIKFESGEKLTCGSLIYAVGSAISTFKEWQFLPTNLIKGQTLTLYFDEPLPLSHSISSLGYMAFDPEDPNELVIGSTYEHEYDHLEPDEEGKSYLIKKANRPLPGIPEKAASTEQWSGVRVSTKDYKPIVGPHPQLPNRYVITGLGSKGMLHGKWTAEQLINHIVDGASIDKYIDIRRFN